MYLEIFLADFAGFRGNTWISRVRDRAKYQKPWFKYSEFFYELNSLQGCTASRHSNVKPPEPEKPITDEKPLGLDEVSML